MGLIVPTAMHPERDDQLMPYEWFVGIDWGSQRHQVCVLDRNRRLVGERAVDHDGASLAQLAAWLWTVSAGQPQRVAVAIEVPRGAIVEGLVERSEERRVGKEWSWQSCRVQQIYMVEWAR